MLKLFCGSVGSEQNRHHQLGVWLVECTNFPNFYKQLWLKIKALLKGTSVMTGIRTHTLLLTTPELGFWGTTCRPPVHAKREIGFRYAEVFELTVVLNFFKMLKITNLYLRCMEVHCDNMVSSGYRKHVCNQLS